VKGYVVTLTPSLLSPNGFASVLNGMFPASSSRLLGSGAFQLTTSEGGRYIVRPAWTVDAAVAGASSLSANKEGGIVYTSGATRQQLFPDFASYQDLENSLKSALQDYSLVIQPNMNGTVTLTTQGISYVLVPNLEVLNQANLGDRHGVWNDNGAFYIKYSDGTVQGFTVK
jgi:hypothetical protein